MANDVYTQIPIMENDRFLLRAISGERDAEDLLKVYSDEKAVPFFNSDNCNGDDFHYETLERMKKAIDFWQFSYEHRYFVRWAVVDQCRGEAVGTIELFCRTAEDYFDNCGLLRLDLRSDYETEDCIQSILGMIVPRAGEMFDCDKLAMKAVADAEERVRALEGFHFRMSEEPLVGQNGTRYDSYYVLEV